MKRNGYCWGIVGVNGAKTRAHVISLGDDKVGKNYDAVLHLGIKPTAKYKRGLRVLGHGCFDLLFVYLVLIPVSCFVVLFSVLFRFQLSVRPNRSQVVRIQLPCISVS